MRSVKPGVPAAAPLTDCGSPNEWRQAYTASNLHVCSTTYSRTSSKMGQTITPLPLRHYTLSQLHWTLSSILWANESGLQDLGNLRSLNRQHGLGSYRTFAPERG